MKRELAKSKYKTKLGTGLTWHLIFYGTWILLLVHKARGKRANP